MEYGLWPVEDEFNKIKAIDVLILVLMEYGLWLCCKNTDLCRKSVLILVLMEYGLWPAAAASINSS